MATRPDDDLAGARLSHERLLATVEEIDDATARRPSLLPGWDVGMVIAHLARNADGHAAAAEGAAVGESRQRYPSIAARDAGIEAGRGVAAHDLRIDLRTAIERLEEAWAALPPEGWDVVARSASGEPEPMVEMPRFRWRESEIHHADLGLGFTVDDWDERFVALELQHWLGGLEQRLPAGGGALIRATDTGESWPVGSTVAPMAVEAPSRHLLAWLTGRSVAGLPDLAEWDW